MSSKKRAEVETIVRWDQDERALHLYTAYGPVAVKWEKRGYPVVAVRNAKGEVTGWRADGLPLRCLTFRTLRREA